MGFQTADAKQAAILESAMTAFSAYGFKKTSMDDIARGADMSRPALYLHFRNKQEILCRMVEGYYAQVTQDVRDVLANAADRPIADVLNDAFLAQGAALMESLMQSAHGMEMLESSMTVAGDLVDEGEAALSVIYADWLTEMAGAGKVRLSGNAEQMARLIYATLKGIKHTAQDYPSYCRELGVFAGTMGQALAV